MCLRQFQGIQAQCVNTIFKFLLLFFFVFQENELPKILEPFFLVAMKAKKSKQLFLTEVKMIMSRCFSWCPGHLSHVSKQLQAHLCKGGSHSFSKEGEAAQVSDQFWGEAQGSVLVSAVFESHHEQALFLIFYNQNGLAWKEF